MKGLRLKWINEQNVWFLFMLICLAIVYNASDIGMEWLVQPNNGWGRLLAYPEVALSHGLLASAMLVFQYIPGICGRLMRRLCGAACIYAGFHALWWIGNVVTAIPLVLGGSKAVFRRTANKGSSN
ncbi:MAG: hypothetical protein ACU837_09190 [Gammaproteobacteria bacterium]